MLACSKHAESKTMASPSFPIGLLDVKGSFPASQSRRDLSQHGDKLYPSPYPQPRNLHPTKLDNHRVLRLHQSPLHQTAAFSNSPSSVSRPPLMEGEEPPLKIAIIGFGNFGKFIAKGLQRQGHVVMATSRSDCMAYCRKQGIQFFRSMDAICEENPDVWLICSSILSTEKVVRSIPFHKLKPDTIFADVLSVKQFPRNLFLDVLPPEFGIVCTHPMFGPESGKDGWAGLPFVFDRVRIAQGSLQAMNCHRFLSIFEHEGCRMVEMSCEEHDRHAAGSQFITHTIGRILSQLKLESTPINTKGYETLLKLAENTVSDSFDLYYGLFVYNVNAKEQIENLDRAFESVKQKLFGRLHELLIKQIVERVPLAADGSSERRRMEDSDGSAPYFLPQAETMKDLSSFAAPGELVSDPKASARGFR